MYHSVNKLIVMVAIDNSGSFGWNIVLIYNLDFTEEQISGINAVSLNTKVCGHLLSILIDYIAINNCHFKLNSMT